VIDELVGIIKVEQKFVSAFFFLCVVMFVSLQTGLLLYVNANRDVPVETDDAYSYIVKAAQMRHDFFQTSNALQSIQEQVAKVSPENKDHVTQRIVAPLFLIYHPVYSFLLLSIHEVGFSWEKSYNILCVIGSLCVGIGMAFWIRAVWGGISAGIALVLLSVNIFPNHGIHYIVPSNLALGLCVWLWLLVIKQTKYKALILGSCIPILSGIHQIGVIYSALLIVLFFVYEENRFTLRSLFVVGSFLLSVGLVFGLPHFVQSPVLAVGNIGSDLNWMQLVSQNFTRASLLLGRTGILSVPLWLVGIVSFTALYIVDAERRKNVLVSALSIFFLCGISLLYVVDGYPAELFSRTIIFWGMWFAGAFSFCFVSLVRFMYTCSSNCLRGSALSQLVPDCNGKVQFSWNKIGTSVMIVLALYFAGKMTFVSLNQYVTTARNMISRQNYSFEPEQPKHLLQRLKVNDVLYFEQFIVPLSLYLSKGFWDNRIVYGALIDQPGTKKEYISENSDLRYAIQYSPIIKVPYFLHGIVSLEQGDRLNMSSVLMEQATRIGFLINCKEANCNVILTQKKNDKVEDVNYALEKDIEELIWFDVSANTDTVSIYSDQSLDVHSITFGTEQQTVWPWQSNLSLELVRHGQPVYPKFYFNERELFENLDLPVKVLFDRGSILVAEIIK